MFVKLTLHPSGEQKFYNMRYVKSFRQGTYSTILELPEGTENVKEKARNIYRMLNGEVIPKIGDTVHAYTGAHTAGFGKIVGCGSEDDMYVIDFGDDTRRIMSEDDFTIIGK